MTNYKTYKRSIFGGVDYPVSGIDQGKGRVYNGDGVPFCLNILYYSAMISRDGQSEEAQYNNTINNGARFSVGGIIFDGTNCRAEK